MRENILPFQAQINRQSAQQTENFGRLKTIWSAATLAFAATAFILFSSGLIVSLMAYLETGFYQGFNSELGGLLLSAAFPLFS